MLQHETIQTLGWDSDMEQSERGVSFASNTIVRILTGVNMFCIVVTVGLLRYFIRPVEGLVVLHYNVYFGVDIQGAWWQIFILPIASVLFLIGHWCIARYFYTIRERIAAYLMLFGAVFMSIGVLIAGIGMIFINY